MIMSLLAYRPFLDPLPVWNYWYLLILPLCAGVFVVYKSMKCRTMKQVPAEAAMLLVWLILSFAAAAVGLMALVNWLAKD